MWNAENLFYSDMKNGFNSILKHAFLLGMMPSLFSLRTVAILAAYIFITFVSLLVAFLLRFDFDFSKISECDLSFPRVFWIVLPFKIFFLASFGQFKGLLSYFHVQDMVRIFWAMLFASLAVIAVSCMFFGGTLIPRGVILGDFVLSTVGFSFMRLSMRMYREYFMRDTVHFVRKKRVAIIGAGDLGVTLASDLLARKSMGITPVVFLDDDPAKIGHQILGLEVLKLKCNFDSLVSSYKIDRVIIAISAFPRTKISEITTAFSRLGVETSIVPSYYELASGYAKVSNFHEVAIEDILGRQQIPLDTHSIDGMIKNKVVMVTGAGGSIGSELCKQIAAKSPSLLILLDHCEVQLFQIEQKIIRGEYGINIKPLVGSVADEKRMERIISKYRPQLIFHAAAHKHVPMMESQPSEALKNNTFGTWNIAELASKYGVEKFLLISTDKAINPTNVMGASKRLAEKAVQAIQNREGNKTQFVAVRFGNVLGSSGSVIPTFKRQISEGGPVTVTHPDVTRYFMTIPEAVGLVLQCAAQAEGGEIFVLDMGEPVKVIDLARHMIRLSGYEPDVDIKIKIIGLRPGEKLYEELQHKNESLVKTANPRIFGFVSQPPSYDEMKSVVEEIKQTADKRDINDLKRFIFKNVPEYRAQFYD